MVTAVHQCHLRVTGPGTATREKDPRGEWPHGRCPRQKWLLQAGAEDSAAGTDKLCREAEISRDRRGAAHRQQTEGCQGRRGAGIG